jgi:hypothetical protein
MSNQSQFAKVLFSTEDGQVETLWATPLGNALYRLDNSPWFAYGVSWQDTIEAHVIEEDGLPVFQRVIEKSGNRTLRLLLDPPADQSVESQEVLNKLVELGCSYEGANPKYIAISIPPSVDLWAVCDFLTETGHRWEHADPTYEELHLSG